VSFAALKKHALGLPGAEPDLKWAVDWTACIGGRMFLVGGPEPGAWTRCAFKVDEHRFLELTGVPGIVPAPYLARAKWVSLQRGDALPLAELKALVTRSHALIAAQLTKQQRMALGIAAPPPA
jgi:predicted DNA-binding protein (MmcQ/YjbR family)